jgi:hypothetical protein
MSSIFVEILRKANLDHYHDNFTAFGIDSLQSLVLLTMQGMYIEGVVLSLLIVAFLSYYKTTELSELALWKTGKVSVHSHRLP